MFNKLFAKINELVDKFSEILTEEELTASAIEVLEIMEEELKENLTEDMEKNEEIFDETMNNPGLWKSIGKKIKKAIKNQNELLKMLLYASAVFAEFDRRNRQKRKEEKKSKEFDKIIKKYLAQIIEIEKNPDIPQDMKEKQIKDIKKLMEKIMKSLEHDR